MTVHVDASDAIRRMRLRARRFPDAAQRPLEQAANEAAVIASGTTAWRDQTGKTRGSIKAQLGPGLNKSSVRARGAAVFLENGTGRYGLRGRDYVITPKNGRYMHFVVNGHHVFTSHVVHPGIKPTHFMRDAGEAMRPKFLAYCVRGARAAIEGR